jgi:hypothetical protein
MATSSSRASGFPRVQVACATCTRGSQRFVRRYRSFLLDPGTLFTLASLILLVIAVIMRGACCT